MICSFTELDELANVFWKGKKKPYAYGFCSTEITSNGVIFDWHIINVSQNYSFLVALLSYFNKSEDFVISITPFDMEAILEKYFMVSNYEDEWQVLRDFAAKNEEIILVILNDLNSESQDMFIVELLSEVKN